MAISIADKKRKAIDKRSQALMSKINMQRTIDGCDIPEIESQGDIDDFNLQMLFGESGDENINWLQMGPEGLIRAYYHIVELCNGKKRNNNITNISTITTTRSSLDAAANLMVDGRGYISGFYKGWASGQDGRTSAASDTEKMKGIRGEFDITSSSFNNNRDKNSAGSYPANNTNILIGATIPSLNTIGSNSPLHSGGVYTDTVRKTWSNLLSDGIVSDTILGRRFSDGNYENITNIIPGIPGESDIPAKYRYGNGDYDINDFYLDEGYDEGVYYNNGWKLIEPNPITGHSFAITSGYVYLDEINYFDPSLYGELDTFINGIDELLLFLNYIKVSDTTFFTTPLIIYDYPDYTEIDGYISSLTTLISDIEQFKTNMIPYYTEGESITLHSARDTVNTLIENLVITLESFDPLFTSIAATFDSSNIYGSPSNAGDLYNIRFLLIKGLINPNDGSKITLKSATSAIISMNNSILQAEDDFGLYGIIKTNGTWIGGLKIPEIAGIIDYTIPDTSGSPIPDDIDYNANFGEMKTMGYIMSWDGTDHATSYDIYKSINWDGTAGTWTKLISNEQHTITEIDLNNGKILTYFIDTDVDVDAGEKPYYKVQAFDNGGSGAYLRIGGESVICDPKNVDDFANSGGGNVPYVGPTGPPPTQPGDIPDYLFKWTTVLYGTQSSDINRKVFKSEALFDSVGSNLEIFINGVLVEAKDYTINSSSEIELITPMGLTDRIVMIVYFGNSGTGGGSGVWKDPVANVGLLPTFGNAIGDVRLVLDTGKLRTWNENERWVDIQIDIDNLDINHNSLNDMADENGINSDHDGRYYTENEVDSFVGDLTVKIDALKYLIPSDATPLSGNLLIQGTPIYTGYLSAGEQNFNILSPQQEFNKIVNSGTFDIILEDAANQFKSADQGVINLYINNSFVDSFNLAINFDENEKTGPQSYPPLSSPSGLIEITSISPWNGYSIYQRGELIIHLQDHYLQTGENSIQIKHEYDGIEYPTENFIFFWNTYTGSIIINDIILLENLIISNKYLSGVRFYTIGDSFNLTFSAEGSFNNVYSLPQIYIDSIEIGHTPYNINYASDGVGYVVPTINENILYASTININEENILASIPLVKINGIGVDGDKTIYNSNVRNILINSYNQYSTDKAEYFVDEYYRLANEEWDEMLTQTSGVWNSNNILAYNDLQVFNHQLQYPINDYSSVMPNQTVNYSSEAGVKSYVRAFIDVGIPHTNGTFYIKGYNPLDTYMHIDIKLPGQTGWLDLLKAFNKPDFYGEDGDGCATNIDGEYFTYTSEFFSSAYSGYLILLRITIDENNISNIEEISINW